MLSKYTQAETLTHHVWQLALGLQTTLKVMEPAYWIQQGYSKSFRGGNFLAEAWHRPKEIRLTKMPAGPISYAVVLHELGHIAHCHRGDSLFETELQAWDWAREHSLLPWTMPILRLERFGLWSHACFGELSPSLSHAIMPAYGGRVGDGRWDVKFCGYRFSNVRQFRHFFAVDNRRPAPAHSAGEPRSAHHASE